MVLFLAYDLWKNSFYETIPQKITCFQFTFLNADILL
jgi:hypothetical protein